MRGYTLVTGATGYLGRHLTDSLLADGIPVRALVHSEWNGEELKEQGIQVVYGDVCDPGTLKESGLCNGVETVYHLVGGGNRGEVDPFQINTEGTRNVMDACRAAELRAFVYVSSSTVYGRQSEWVDEETPPAPRFDYPQSKVDAEELLLQAAREAGLPAKVVRMAGIYGPEASMLGADLVRQGRLRITGEGRNVISVIHVADAVRGLRAVAARGRAGQIYCLGDHEPVAVYTFHNHLAELLGAPPVRTTSVGRVRVLVRVHNLLSRLASRRPLALEAMIELATLNVGMRNTKVREELGLEFQYPTYREGLAQCADWILTDEEE
jgi:nucleoside-diphosphate-sugar epimerase